MEIENVRIINYDQLNVMIERYEESFNKSKNETTMKWRFKGYKKTILDALKFIARNELLIDKNAISDLKSYLEQVEKSNQKILEIKKGPLW